MRILLVSNAAYFPPRGGSTRSNLIWLRHLAGNGHACRVVCAAAEPNTGAERELIVGGHSPPAMQLLSRMREGFPADLSKRGDDEALLAKLEQLSDEPSQDGEQ